MLLEKEKKENYLVIRLFLTYFVKILIITSILFLYIFQSIRTASMEKEIEKLESKILDIKMEQKRLKTELSFLSSPDNIIKNLSFYRTTEDDILYLEYYEKKFIVKSTNKTIISE